MSLPSVASKDPAEKGIEIVEDSLMNLPWTWETLLLRRSGPHSTPGARVLAFSALFASHFFEHPTCKLKKDNLRMDIGIVLRKGRLSFDKEDFSL